MSQLEVDKIIPQSGTTLTIGETGDTISFASGVLPSLESLTITGDLTVDTDTLYVDSTNNRVGIGTTSPATALEVIGSINSSDGGTQGILINPSGSIEIANTGGGALIDFKTSTSEDRDARIRQVSDGLSFETGGNGSVSEAMRITSSGNVGIGTTSPSYQLSVSDGTVQAGISPQSTIGYAGTFSNHPYAFTTNNIERMRIDTSGNVGIGTSSPSGKLNVVGERIVTNAGAIGTNLSLGGRSIGITGVENLSTSGRAGFVNRIINDFAVINDNAGFMHLYPFSDGDDSYAFRASVGTTLSDTFYVKQQGDAYFSGNVGIGTTSPAQKLEVNGNIRVAGTGGIQYTGITGGTTNRIAFRWSSPNLSGAVDNVAFFVVGTTSDHRLKNNVENLSSVLDKINLLRPITFNAISLQEGDVVNDVNHIGFIAHEVAEHFPSLVEGEKDAVNDEGNNLYQSLNYAGFTPILTKAIQELKADNDALRSTVADLTARLEALENA